MTNEKHTPSDPVEEELLLMDIDDILMTSKETARELQEAWDEFEAGNVAADIAPDAPLKLEEAICLPELGGVLTVNRAFAVASPSLTVKSLRNAIEAGSLRTVRPNRKNLYVTRRAIQEWLTECQDQRNPPISSSGKSAATALAVSRTKPSGSSKTEKFKSAQDAALKTLMALKKPSKST